MAAVEVTISGVLYNKTARTTEPVVIIGEASLTGLGPGGGPIIPPDQKPPLGIWGPTDPRPTPPIVIPPPGGPPGIWPNPPEGTAPLPEHPIVIPPDKPPVDPSTPPVSWKPVWVGEEQGWVVVGVIDPSIPHPVPSA